MGTYYMPVEFGEPLNLVGEVADGQPVAHFWRQEYDFWSSPPEGRILRRVCCLKCCVILCELAGLSSHRCDW